jgi:hypothetical protein
MRGCWLRVENCRVSLAFDPFDLFRCSYSSVLFSAVFEDFVPLW